MKTLTFTQLLILSLFSSFQAYTQCADTCNIYSFTYAENSYELVQELKSWEEAAQCAVERGGYLAHIDSLEEQTAIYDAILASGIPSNYTSVPNGGSIAYIWIGATDNTTEGAWLWDGDNNGTGDNFWNGQGSNGAGDGTAVDGFYVNWGGTSAGVIKEPDDYVNAQDGAAIGLTGWPNGSGALGIAGEWNDIFTSSKIYYLVEYDTLKAPIGECAPPVSIKTNEKGFDFEIFPNPSHDRFNLNMGEAPVQNLKLEILNTRGVQVQNLNLPDRNSVEIDLSDNPGGIYFIKLYVDNDIVVRKVCLME